MLNIDYVEFVYICNVIFNKTFKFFIMVRIFIYSNCLIPRHELVINSVEKSNFDVFRTRVSFKVSDILGLFDNEDLPFTLGYSSEVDNDECKIYLVLDTSDNKLVNSFSVVLNSVLSFA